MAIKFDLSNVPQLNGATITDAKLDFYFMPERDGYQIWEAPVFKVFYAVMAWTESGPYNAVVSHGDEISSKSFQLEGGSTRYLLNDWQDFDVTSAVQQFVATPSSNKGFIFRATEYAAYCFSSSEATDVSLRPKLVITYTGGTPPPPAPTGEFTSPDTVSVIEGSNLDYTISHNGGDKAVVSVIGTKPSWMTVDVSNGKITGTTPQVTSDKVETVKLELKNGTTALDTLTLKVTVKNVVVVPGMATTYKSVASGMNVYAVSKGRTGFMVDVPTSGLLTLKAYDISGKVLFNSSLNATASGKHFIPCESKIFNRGTFITVMEQNGNKKVKKITVIK